MIRKAYSNMYAGCPCPTAPAMVCSQPGCMSDENPEMVAGISRIELAKIGGITPEVLIFSGMCVVSPPNMRLPICRLGYCTGMRRCARSMNTMKAMVATAITAKARMKNGDSAPVRPSSSSEASALGSPATMPAMMIRLMPLPTPRAVICSPSHIRNIVPPTSVITQVRRKNHPGSITALPKLPCMLSSPTAMP